LRTVAKDSNEILAWVADIFETPTEKIRPETKRDEIEAWDSLGILTLMARLDEDFQVLLTEEEIQQLRSVKDILNLLRKRDVLGDNP
jgi:acyl carrier protein